MCFLCKYMNIQGRLYPGSRKQTKITKCKRIEIRQSMFPDHKGIRLKIDNRKIIEKSLNTWKLNNMLANNLWSREISRRIRKYFVLNENENTTHKNLWDAALARWLSSKGCRFNSQLGHIPRLQV